MTPTLLEKIASRSKEGQIKTSEQVFSAAFMDELEKLGYDTEFLKTAGFISGIAKFFNPPQTGGQLLKLKPKLTAASAMTKGTFSPTMKTVPATADPYANLMGRDKSLAQQTDRKAGMKKVSMDKNAIGLLAAALPLAARALPTIGRFAKGLIGIGKAPGTAGQVGTWTGRAGVASSFLPKKAPKQENLL